MLNNIKNKGRARLFSNPLLEQLSQTRPWVIYAIYIPLNIFLICFVRIIYNYNYLNIAAVFFIAMLLWTLAEYLTHRYLFHLKPKGKTGKRLVYIFHENHHEFPRDRRRLFMPPAPSLLIASSLMLVFIAVTKLLSVGIGYAFVFFSGFTSGYLLYVSLHYAIHAYPPPKFLKALWRNHHLHHYRFPEKAFGVSSNLWDRIFGTLPQSEN